ncbi:sensor histidine kinase [Dyella tabacisoli]|nr:HAMP domain-containing sensor histidine kinase [Dyella tabacisoli]
MTFRRGTFYRRIGVIFGSQLIAVAIASVMGATQVVPVEAMLILIAIFSVSAWLATRRQWLQVSRLAGAVEAWDEQQAGSDVWLLGQLPPHTDVDVAVLSRRLDAFAHRIAEYNQRERDFTRDASHELRSPLTVIKMSADLLADEPLLGEPGQRSVQRIKRASREMEALVEALLILARESDNGLSEEDFVVNDVLKRELDAARDLLEGQPIVLQLEEPVRFALHGSPRVFAVLCWQLIRNACQQAEQGTIVITVMPGMVTVANRSPVDGGVDRHGFELAIAQRISERFAWPLELQTREDHWHVARIRFPQPLSM